MSATLSTCSTRKSEAVAKVAVVVSKAPPDHIFDLFNTSILYTTKSSTPARAAVVVIEILPAYSFDPFTSVSLHSPKLDLTSMLL